MFFKHQLNYEKHQLLFLMPQFSQFFYQLLSKLSRKLLLLIFTKDQIFLGYAIQLNYS